nr:MAG TPA: hypothetical protein [Caudoviricetes sp.]
MQGYGYARRFDSASLAIVNLLFHSWQPGKTGNIPHSRPPSSPAG